MSDAPDRMLTLDERKALLWVRRHQPTQWGEPDAPSRRMRLVLLNAKLIGFWPGRQRFDPISYSLTERGEKALAP